MFEADCMNTGREVVPLGMYHGLIFSRSCQSHVLDLDRERYLCLLLRQAASEMTSC